MHSNKKVSGAKMRHKRLRKRLSGSSSRPRLCIHLSGRHIYAQVVDDSLGQTLVSANTTDPTVARVSSDSGLIRANTATAAIVGREIALRAIAAGISSVVFDRGGFLYHGRVKTLADSARDGGLLF
ncbi:MAG: hypothetical protein RLZZ399_822 [Verrucomicrobiota bacterium]|jgi:large subunit ribosomal protein L18